ncbi:hypothetical protein [Paraburkholderia tagetis]|uniref:Uncharacterized protein n=1 Tax=Paraburkholderia tagetis TaxID=2913261 RepID=A0A9X1RX06_9BURK|nr:hypothetical protein [Paraburkholderia tagetis]MCG5076068.1 hypothetical protein [Paraburkholderia tagetis]
MVIARRLANRVSHHIGVIDIVLRERDVARNVERNPHRLYPIDSGNHDNGQRKRSDEHGAMLRHAIFEPNREEGEFDGIEAQCVHDTSSTKVFKSFAIVAASLR